MLSTLDTSLCRFGLGVYSGPDRPVVRKRHNGSTRLPRPAIRGCSPALAILGSAIDVVRISSLILLT